MFYFNSLPIRQSTYLMALQCYHIKQHHMSFYFSLINSMLHIWFTSLNIIDYEWPNVVSVESSIISVVVPNTRTWQQLWGRAETRPFPVCLTKFKLISWYRSMSRWSLGVFWYKLVFKKNCFVFEYTQSW